MSGSLANRRILIVEDNALIGSFIADVIEEAGGQAIGPIMTRDQALEAIERAEPAFDAAILDLRIDGTSATVADRLHELDVPFVFATGNRADIPASHRGRPVCDKPFTPKGLLAILRLVFESGAPPPR